MTYRIATADCNGAWDIVEEFEADSADEANQFALAHYPDLDWYVLDSNDKNVNA